MGLILKCNEIKEKIRHLKKRGRDETFVSQYFIQHVGENKNLDWCDAYLEILHQVVKYPQALWVLTILDIDQRTDFCRLDERKNGFKKKKKKKKKKKLRSVCALFTSNAM
jgi:hypothetical protein